jgi:hypothetical protein
MERAMKRTLTLLLMTAAFAAALATTAQATGQRIHKPFIAARLAGYEPPDPCLNARLGFARCVSVHHAGNIALRTSQ